MKTILTSFLIFLTTICFGQSDWSREQVASEIHIPGLLDSIKNQVVRDVNFYFPALKFTPYIDMPYHSVSYSNMLTNFQDIEPKQEICGMSYVLIEEIVYNENLTNFTCEVFYDFTENCMHLVVSVRISVK